MHIKPHGKKEQPWICLSQGNWPDPEMSLHFGSCT